MSQSDPQLIGCSAGCGNKVRDPEHDGWTYLEITKRWRCPNCTRELNAINFPPQPKETNEPS